MQKFVVAINNLVMPVMVSSFNTINWTLAEIKKIGMKVRQQRTYLSIHHQRVDIERLLVKRENSRGESI